MTKYAKPENNDTQLFSKTSQFKTEDALYIKVRRPRDHWPGQRQLARFSALLPLKNPVWTLFCQQVACVPACSVRGVAGKHPQYETGRLPSAKGTLSPSRERIKICSIWRNLSFELRTISPTIYLLLFPFKGDFQMSNIKIPSDTD